MTIFRSKGNHTIVGIDPANQGALVVLQGSTVPLVVLWRKATHKKKPVFKVSYSHLNSNVAKQSMCRTSAHIGSLVSSIPILSKVNGISVEDCYLARNVKTTISLARFAGSISAPLVVKTGFNPCYVKPTEWRKLVMGLNQRTNRENAKRLSLSMMPKIVPSINHHLDILGNHDHITDALGIAVWLAMSKNY